MGQIFGSSANAAGVKPTDLVGKPFVDMILTVIKEKWSEGGNKTSFFRRRTRVEDRLVIASFLSTKRAVLNISRARMEFMGR
eukprot:1394309-Amorphochlora_amoeboformis.AAC.2